MGIFECRILITPVDRFRIKLLAVAKPHCVSVAARLLHDPGMKEDAQRKVCIALLIMSFFTSKSSRDPGILR
jgi:hypothetical protein